MYNTQIYSFLISHFKGEIGTNIWLMTIKNPEQFNIQDFVNIFLLSHQDSNLDQELQKLWCYLYTIGQEYYLSQISDLRSEFSEVQK